MEVESPSTLRQLAEAREKNDLLSEKLSNQNDRCKQLEEHIRKSDEYSCNLQHKVTGQCTLSVVEEEGILLILKRKLWQDKRKYEIQQ